MILQGDCGLHLIEMDADSVDSMVTDPPGGINFMGKNWDHDKGGRQQWIEYMKHIFVECLRVMKPGAHGFVWALPRTSHWTATALEDAGFQIREIVTHVFGSGFPKSLNISKAIDSAAGAERKIIGPSDRHPGKSKKDDTIGDYARFSNAGDMVTAPATPEAKKWDGWGTALKPASEHWILIRKPLSEKTVAQNVMAHSTGGLNIDASRIGKDTITIKGGGAFPEGGGCAWKAINKSHQGRFPANFILSHNPDCELIGEKKVKGSLLNHICSAESKNGIYQRREPQKRQGFTDKDGTETVANYRCTEGCAVAELDQQSGFSKSVQGKKAGGKTFHGIGYDAPDRDSIGDSGGASRFFYCAKASKSERNAGLEGMPENGKERHWAQSEGRKDAGQQQSSFPVANHHPTVKAQKLMCYLIKMVTPPGGTILDPFMGSGSTGVAAVSSGFEFLGIEQEKEYIEIAKRRIEYAKLFS